MITEQHRKMLECAAKACGITGVWQEGFGICVIGDYLKDPGEQVKFWNPLANPADTANMCARLEIDTYWFEERGCVLCCTNRPIRHREFHNGTPEGKEAAWRLAASTVAAKVGGYADDI